MQKSSTAALDKKRSQKYYFFVKLGIKEAAETGVIAMTPVETNLSKQQPSKALDLDLDLQNHPKDL